MEKHRYMSLCQFSKSRPDLSVYTCYMLWHCATLVFFLILFILVQHLYGVDVYTPPRSSAEHVPPSIVTKLSSLSLSNYLYLSLLPCVSTPIALLPSCLYDFKTFFPGLSSRFLLFYLTLSYLFISSFVPLHIHRSIRISEISQFFSCAFFTANVSAPYNCPV